VKVSDFTVLSNVKIAKDVYKMILKGDTSHITDPGQFINIALEGSYLRRPISVNDYDSETVTIIYKVVGGGTEKMSVMTEGENLNVMTGLGNGFSPSKCNGRALLVGGGVGVPPLYRLAKELDNPIVVLGFNSAEDVFFVDEFKELSDSVYVSTADGSMGTKGFVTDVIKDLSGFDYTYSCGPEPMLKALYNATDVSGEYSFEERMGCGFGACMGCSCKTKYGNKRICKDGPVLEKEEIIW
jgi:dihydroorotate dehydrogenase electron transfer subunit